MINRNSGFTLVEISIVLVIIGLILGAVMVGSGTLIANTKVTSTITLIKDLSGAVADFKGRYHYLPGDLPNAASDIAGIATGATCDILPNSTIGNGQIDTAAERDCVAAELVQAGLIKGSASGILSPYNNSQSGDVFVLTTNQAASTKTAVSSFSGNVQNAIEIKNIPYDAALAIDSKIDDGNLVSGNIRAFPIPNASGVPPTNTTLDVGL